ncbi:hypothetical protein DVH05_000291 [Phytophthora capsici]|nr:hypothetical protein DVH05_000291 [Phytophthora capsici]
MTLHSGDDGESEITPPHNDGGKSEITPLGHALGESETTPLITRPSESEITPLGCATGGSEITPLITRPSESEITPLGYYMGGEETLPLDGTRSAVERSDSMTPISANMDNGPVRRTKRPNVTPGEASCSNLIQFLRRRQRSFDQTLLVRARLLSLHRETARSGLHDALVNHGIRWPKVCPQSTERNGAKQYLLDTSKQRAFSLFLRRSRMRLADFVMLLRGESRSDPRPNKALELPDHLPG